MAADASNDLTFYLVVDHAHQSDLAALRQWTNLKVAFDEQQVWVRDFNAVQIAATEVKSIPYKKLYAGKNGKLFPLGSALPERNIPASLLWTPIDRALPVKLPSLNHNFFGVAEQVSVRLVPSENETEAVAMRVPTDVLTDYILQAPAVRLRELTWALVDRSQAFLLGKPLLPVTGATYWKRGNNLLPTGYDFDLHVLADAVSHSVNPQNDAWIAWNADSSCFLLPKSDLKPLSLSSFRSTLYNR